ncbi:MAG TPA: lysylphosphatidylglycerol synthase transmembrane domain-containing protein [Woeseiaceae bacterium]|nr:lysylphosphatidylglycerol synthase transmembrane domain-containing protein [Woeseiaceae bacterium]
MTPKAKVRIALAIGILVAILLMGLALRDVEWPIILSSLKNANFLFVIPISMALMLQYWFKALRWKILLNPFASVATAQVFPATVVGYLANLVFPAYLGEFARVYLLGKQLRLRYSSVMATVVLERFFDFLSVLFFVGIVLIADSSAPAELKTVGVVAGAASGALLLMLAAVLVWTEALTRLVLKMTAFLPDAIGDRLAEQLALGAVGLQSVRDLRRIPSIAVTSLLQWGAMGLCIYLGMIGTGLQVPLSAGFVVLALTVMGVTLPSSPGFFGTIQLCFTLGLAPYGIAASEAFAASIFFHLTIYVAGWAAGLYYLRQSGLTLGGLHNASIDQENRSLHDRH